MWTPEGVNVLNLYADTWAYGPTAQSCLNNLSCFTKWQSTGETQSETQHRFYMDGTAFFTTAQMFRLKGLNKLKEH